MLEAFPKELRQDVLAVRSILFKEYKESGQDILLKETAEKITYRLLDGQEISFPYRIYDPDVYDRCSDRFTPEQRMICRCLFTRSDDGFVRERHGRAILEEGCPDWAVPYLVKLADEYVIQILQCIYDGWRELDTEAVRDFCRLNRRSLLRSYDRMVSYWNEFYREEYPHLEDYVGEKLFRRCFGYPYDGSR